MTRTGRCQPCALHSWRYLFIIRSTHANR